MSNNEMGDCGESNTVTERPRTSAKRSKSEGQDDQLLPGMPNRITLDHICTKLPWKTFCNLSSVSPTWREAIQSRCVYNARICARSTDTLLVHSHPFEIDYSCEGLFLYCPREEQCYELPHTPGCYRGIPWECQCIALDGKIYILGGGTGYGESCGQDDEFKEVYNAVYVLDLVGPRAKHGRTFEWQQCASMQEGRLKFGCGVVGGKNYVFGGASHCGPVRGSEVYDPKTDTWSPTRPMKGLRFGHHVARLGEVLLVFGGEVFDPDHDEDLAKPYLNENGYRRPCNSVHDALFLEAYHPVKNEWREVERFHKHKSETVFVAEGKFYLITQGGIFVQDSDNKSWKDLHLNSFPRYFRSTNLMPQIHAPVRGSDALYLGVENVDSSASCLLKGKGFGSEKVKIVWHEIDCGENSQPYADLKCGIQL